MNREELEEVNALASAPPMALADSLRPEVDRTLMYGYTCDRDTVHVYMHNGMIHILYYNSSGKVAHRSAPQFGLELLVPEKRAYPENADPALAKMLALAQVPIDYLPFDDERYMAVQNHAGTYWGETLESLDR